MVYEPFDYGAPSQFVGTTLNALGTNGADDGVLGTYQLLGGSASNANIVSGSLSGSLPSTGNAISVQANHRGRQIIDRTTPEFLSSGIVDGNGLLGADGTSLYGSVLMQDTRSNKAPFMGLELAIGNSGNRSIVIGDEEKVTSYDKNNGGGVLGTIPLVEAGTTAVQEIIFRFDFGASDADTFTLIDPITLQDVPGVLTGDFEFSTFHWTAFSGSDPVLFDEFRLGTALEDVTDTSVFTAAIDRSTGALTISNAGGRAVSVIGYTVKSDVGALDQTEWNSIAQNGDADSGGSLDGDDVWIELSDPSINTDLSELQVGGAGPQDGVSIQVGQTIHLGNVWFPAFTEDVELELLLNDRSLETVTINFTGTTVMGDFDRDTDVDGTDLLEWQQGFDKPYGAAELTAWQGAYGNTSSLVAASQSVPEPSSLLLLILGGIGFLQTSRSGTSTTRYQARPFGASSKKYAFARIGAYAVALLVLGVAGSVIAQTPAAPILSSYQLELDTFATHTEFQPGNGSNPIGVGDQFGAIDVTAPKDGSGRVFVSTQPGKILSYDSAGNSLGNFLDLSTTTATTGFTNNNGSSAFRGLMYFDFHPDFAVQGAAGEGKIYTGYAVNSSFDNGGVNADYRIQDFQNRPGSNQYAIAEWEVNASGTAIDTSSFREVYRYQTEGSNPHGLGEIAFNPNAQPGDADYGLLYAAVADGNANGNGAPATGYLQELDNPFGKIIRINPLANGPDDYSVPSSNPFFGQAGVAEEIYALGFRDQQTFSFAKDSNDENILITFDIGAAEREEVSLVRAGGNYGWERFEGTLDFDPTVSLAPESPIHSPPVLEYVHNNVTGGFAIIGGLLVSDPTEPSFTDKVIFSDLPNGKLFYADYNEMLIAEANGTQAQIFQVDQFTVDGSVVTEDGTANGGLDGLISFEDVYQASRGDARFGTDEAGNVYIVTKQSGAIYKTGLLATPDTTQLLNGILGDVNQDGVVSGDGTGSIATDDISAFRAGWLSNPLSNSFDQFQNGDMNLDGATNLLDALILHDAFENAGTSLSLGSLLHALTVPEPSAFAVIMCGVLLCGFRLGRNKRR